MKKLMIAALALTASAAFAQVTGFVKYDHVDVTNGSSNGQEIATGLAVSTKVGVFDAAVTGARASAGGTDRAVGSEFGYSNSVSLQAGTVTGRVAIGQLNGLSDASVRFYSLGAEFTAPLTEKVAVFAGYRHRNSTNVKISENRYTAGIDYAVTSKLKARVGYASTHASDRSFNGVTTAVSYAF